MSESTVAFRYAKSLISLAQEQNLVDEVYQDMTFFKQTADNNRDLMLALRSPIIRNEKKQSMLKAIFKPHVNPVSYSIFDIITKKSRESIMYAIADEFIRQYNDLKGIQKAQVITTQPLTDELRKQFTNMVAKATGKTVQLEESVDPKLIGGYVLRIGDRQVDASIRSQLNDLRLSFMN